MLSRVQLFPTPWTVAHPDPMFMRFSQQEYWSGVPFPSPGDLPNPGIKLTSPALAGGFLTTEPPGKSHSVFITFLVNGTLGRKQSESKACEPFFSPSLV